MDFICDVMLGKLTRWLRLMGLKTHYDAAAEDDALIKKAMKLGATLVTRDRRLAVKAGDFCKAVLIRANDAETQLEEFTAATGIRPRRTLSASFCPMCGSPLEKAAKAAIKAEVYPRVYSRQKAFWRCPNCLQIYWRGSHTREINRILKGLRTT